MIGGPYLHFPPYTSYTPSHLQPGTQYQKFLGEHWEYTHPEKKVERLEYVHQLRQRREDKEAFVQSEMLKHFYNIGVLGAKVGLVGGAAFAAYKQMRASTPEWLVQINKFREDEFTADPILIGQQSYLVSIKFPRVENAHSGNHYELYLMPEDVELADVFHSVVDALDAADEVIKKHVAFVVIRATPGTTYANGRKVLPRIIVGFKDGVSQAQANVVLKIVDRVASQHFDFGSGRYPRYSKPVIQWIKSLIYAGFGSGDYKEMHPDEFERNTGLFWNAPDDMAYKNSGEQVLSLSADQQEQES